MKSMTVWLLAVLLLTACAAQAAPHLTIKDAAFDFGFVPQHSKVSHVFTLFSTGDDSLKIVRVEPG